MPAAVITRDDAERIRRNLQARGAEIPDALKNLPTPQKKAGSAPAVQRPAAGVMHAAGGGTTQPAAPRPAAADKTEPAPHPLRGRPASPRRPGGGAGRFFGGRRPGRRRRLSLAGDGGGLLLAFWLYPLALATLQHGIAGPGIWLRAKFLNRDMTGAATSGGTVAPATPAGPSNATPAAPNPNDYAGGGSRPPIPR